MHHPTIAEKAFLAVVILFPLAALVVTPWPDSRDLFSPHHPCNTGVHPANHLRCK